MDSIYVIYGTVYDLIKRKINEIKKDNYDVITYDLSKDGLNEALDDASCMSLIGDKKLIIGENALFLTSEAKGDTDTSYLEKYINYDNHDNIIIFSILTEKLDERKKIVKLLKSKANVINILPIDNKNINDFVLNEFKTLGYKIDLKTVKYFTSYVGSDIGIILSEINKLVMYKDGEREITIDDINDISSKALNDNVFDFCDAIMKKNYKKIFDCYNDLIYLKTEPSKIIAVLANQFILLYQVKSLVKQNKSESVIATLLNVHPYRVKLANETDYMLFEISSMIKKMHELDLKIKSGNNSDNNILESFLLHL